MGKEILRRKNEETRAKTEMVSGELCSQKTPAAVKAVERETFFFLDFVLERHGHRYGQGKARLPNEVNVMGPPWLRCLRLG